MDVGCQRLAVGLALARVPDPFRERCSCASPTEVREERIDGVDQPVQGTKGARDCKDSSERHRWVSVFQPPQRVARNVGPLSHLDSSQVEHPPPGAQMSADTSRRPFHPDRDLLRHFTVPYVRDLMTVRSASKNSNAGLIRR